MFYLYHPTAYIYYEVKVPNDLFMRPIFEQRGFALMTISTIYHVSVKLFCQNGACDVIS
jgi:hypothetical protein